MVVLRGPHDRRSPSPKRIPLELTNQQLSPLVPAAPTDETSRRPERPKPSELALGSGREIS
jgi:hypothetical protein